MGSWSERINSRLHPWPRELLGLEWTRRRIVLVQASDTHSPQPILTRYAVKALPESLRDPENEKWAAAMADFLRELCARQGFTCRRAVITLPETDCIVRKFILPPLAASERREAAFWDFLPYVPYEQGTFVTSLAPVPGDPEQAFLAAAVPKKILAGWQEVCSLLDWTLIKLEPAILARGRLLPPDQNILLLHRCGRGGSLTAYTGQYPAASDWWAKRPALEEDGRRILFQEEDGGESDDAARAWGTAAERMLEFLSRQDHLSISRFLIAGDGKPDPLQLEQLAAHSHIRTESFAAAGVRFVPSYADGRLRRDEGMLLTACGAVHKGRVPYFLDLAAAARQGRAYWQHVLPRWFLAASLAICLAGALFAGILERQVRNARQVSPAFASWEMRRRDFLALQEQAEAGQKLADAAKNGSLHWYYLLTELGVVLPDSCCLVRVEQKKGREGPVLLLQGRSRKRNELLSFLETLRHEPWIRRAELGGLAREKDSPVPAGKAVPASGAASEFTITLELVPGGTYETAGSGGEMETLPR